MNSAPMFRVRLLGSPCAVRANGALLTGRAAQRHRLGLLALLSLATAPGLSREKLTALLWPESSAEQGRNLLNVSVYVLRKALGEDAVISNGDDLRLNTEAVGVDVVDFESALDNGNEEAAVALYRGPFLDGFFLSDALEFERWVDRERGRLAGRLASALESLAAGAEGRGDSALAVKWWKARAAHDPYDSRVAVRLMLALDVSGNRAGAIQHGSIHERLLREEFGMEPAAEVLELAERLRTEPPARVHDPPANVRTEPPVRLYAGPPAPMRPQPPAPPQRPEEEAKASGTGAAAERHDDTPSSQTVDVTPPPASKRLHPAIRYGIAAVALSALFFGASRLGPTAFAPPPVAPREPSIAVLPLTSFSADPADVLLADGMTEELIARLARNRDLRVIARTSVFAFRNRQIDIGSIADSLGVSSILEGGLQRIGSRIRVQIRLIDARDRSTRWSETYDRELEDVFAVQSEIARSVAGELGLRLGGVAATVDHRRPTQSVAAYEFYLRGSDPVLLRSDSGVLEALEYFRRAIAADSTFAAAYAGVARIYLRLRSASDRDISTRDLLQRAETNALMAVALDDSLAEAHATLGVVRLSSYDFASAETQLRRAISLDPARARTREWLVGLYLLTGRPADALAEAERARDSDPLSPSAQAELARALAANGRCDEALARLRQIAELQPPLLRAAHTAATCHIERQMWPEAISVLRPQAEVGHPQSLAMLGYVLARAGQREEALGIHQRLLDRSRRIDGAVYVAVVYAGLGELDRALDWLERSIDDGSLSNNLLHLPLSDVVFQDLRGLQRFELLLERLGLQKL